MAITTADGGKRTNKNLVKVYSAMNPTIGTGIAEAIKTSFAATAAMALVRNATAGMYVRPQYIRLINTVVPASATRSELAIAIDKGATRYSSGGSSLTATNRDMASSVTSSTVTRFGALVTAAASANVRYVARAQLRGAIAVQYEEFLITFGGDGHRFNTLSGTAVQRQVVDVGPVVLGVNQEMIVHTWHPANAATPPSWEVEVCWTEARK